MKKPSKADILRQNNSKLQKLLTKYMAHVIVQSGTSQLAKQGFLTTDEFIILRTLSDEAEQHIQEKEKDSV